MNEIEAYANKHKRLHPKVIDIMAPLFKEYKWNPSSTRIKIVGPYMGKLSGRGSPTAAFVVGNTIYMMRGALNAEQPVRNNNWNLASINGFATLSHEVFHTYQNHRDGFRKFVSSLVRGVLKSLRYSKKTYDHQFFPYEQEATEFERKIKNQLTNDKLKDFTNMR